MASGQIRLICSENTNEILIIVPDKIKARALVMLDLF